MQTGGWRLKNFSHFVIFETGTADLTPPPLVVAGTL